MQYRCMLPSRPVSKSSSRGRRGIVSVCVLAHARMHIFTRNGCSCPLPTCSSCRHPPPIFFFPAQPSCLCIVASCHENRRSRRSGRPRTSCTTTRMERPRNDDAVVVLQKVWVVYRFRATFGTQKRRVSTSHKRFIERRKVCVDAIGAEDSFRELGAQGWQ